jgi:YrbI family 3-deoxy-D-manno-octulosonate 8-phosphate phosphatase
MTTHKKNIISIIPARGGSKGIPNKNIIEISGKPLIAWTIEQSISTKTISKTYVSTNDAQIADVAESFGAEIIWRPDELCEDDSTSETALIHALAYLNDEKQVVPDYVVFLQVTSPLRKSSDISNSVLKIISDGADSLFSGSKFDDFLFWEKDRSELKSINYDYHNRGRRQDRLPQFVENGSIYITKPAIILENCNRLGGEISIYEMEFWQTWEIDTMQDIELIEYYIRGKVKSTNETLIDKIELIVYDFDGVMTNNKAIVDEKGNESVMINRGDGLAIAEIKKLNIPQIILSTEKNVVVQKRAEKINIPFMQGVKNKKVALNVYIKDHNININKVAYIGNDFNDLDIMKIVGIPISPADGAPEIKGIAKIITKKNGGDGVIREFFDMLKNNNYDRDN